MNLNYVGIALLCVARFYFGSMHEASRIRHDCEDDGYPVIIDHEAFVCQTLGLATYMKHR